MEKNINFIGLGGTGNHLLHSIVQNTSLIDDPDKQCYYVNFSATDLSKKFKGKQLLLDEGGTGKDLKRGQEIVNSNSKTILNFLEPIYKNLHAEKNAQVVIISSFGGGTGSSLTPFVLDFFSEFPEIKISLIGVMSSPKEGVAILPNSVKNFQNIYNNYILPSKVTSALLFDNEVFEKKYALDTYNFSGINGYISEYVEEIYNNKVYKLSTEGFPSLDLNEKLRVQYYGKGLSDFIVLPLSFQDEDYKLNSSIFGGNFKTSAAKAVSVLVKFKKRDNDVKEKELEYVNKLVQDIRKKFSSAFFVFGYSFNNSNVDYDIQVNILSNGLEAPKAILSDIKKAQVAVEKIKKVNTEFSGTDDVDLDF